MQPGLEVPYLLLIRGYFPHLPRVTLHRGGDEFADFPEDRQKAGV